MHMDRSSTNVLTEIVKALTTWFPLSSVCTCTNEGPLHVWNHVLGLFRSILRRCDNLSKNAEEYCFYLRPSVAPEAFFSTN